ncbi:MAG: GAF domain-containing protein [Ardenticatenales bacterium]|nr:GAF domain-containing protein [Ardenticatenales bacterium]
MDEQSTQLIETIRQIAASEEDTEAFLWQVVEVIPQWLNDQHLIFVWLLDEAGEWLWARAGTGELGCIVVERQWRAQAGSRHPVAEAVRSSKPFLLDNERFAADWEQRIPRPAPLFAEDWSLSLPLHHKEQVIGVIAVYSRECVFDSALIPTMQGIAEEVAARLARG